jgi:CheY-like chemotaxis protein
MKILIIDDDEMISEIWSIALKKEGYEVITAMNGKDGINEAKTKLPNLILIDQIMPDIKGNDLLRMLKDDPQTKAIPVAVVSNYNESQLMQDSIQAGAIDYILKYQIEPQDLVNKVKTLIQEPLPPTSI